MAWGKMEPMGSSYWPLFDLEVRTDRLLLRPPRDDDLPGLLDAIDEGIHEPEVMPFSQPWTDAEPTSRRRGTAQYFWTSRATWRTDKWDLPFAVFHEGRAIGVQSIFARQFPVFREVASGSWLCQSAQGRGYGKEMRSAVLQLAFEGLNAVIARSGAFAHNQSSAGVSKALGYRENGTGREAPRGEPQVMVHYELTREQWLSQRDALPRAEVVGLDQALPMFGLPDG